MELSLAGTGCRPACPKTRQREADSRKAMIRSLCDARMLAPLLQKSFQSPLDGAGLDELFFLEEDVSGGVALSEFTLSPVVAVSAFALFSSLASLASAFLL